ncbi:MAG: NTP transferase domain-containing protein [Planctomycetaceae bacterium]|nr:NTP transferase domain-containing protein [Planctomycetaceae bacterium]
MPTTANTPKCFAEVSGKRLLDWAIDAFRQNGIQDIVFIGGYQIESVQESNPEFVFRHNSEWPINNILASLMCSEDLMDEPFLCCYSDVLFTPAVVESILRSNEDIVLGVDTDWLTRYEQRTEHPSDDAEKVTVQNGAVTCIHRNIPETEAYGEFIGLAGFSAEGASTLRDDYHQRRLEYSGLPYREAKVFEKAYMIHLFQDMIESGRRMAHVDTPGGYIEVDTQQDFEYARQHWIEKHLFK